MPFSDSEELVTFISKIDQWKRTIFQLHKAQKYEQLGGKLLFDVVKDGENTQVKHFIGNFERLNVGYFDRLDRHQVIVEVAPFVMPFFFTGKMDITKDKRHHFYLTQMLLTVKGGVEFAIMLLA